MSLDTSNFIEDNQIVISGNVISFKNFYNKVKTEKLFTLSSKDIHEQIKNIPYNESYNSTGKIKSEDMENYKMIPFAYVFYYLLATTSKIPLPEEVLNQYLKFFCIKNASSNTYQFKDKYIISTSNLVFEKNTLYARICRAYPSYIREVELLVKLKEKFNKKAVVKYDSVADLCCGIDLIISTKNKLSEKEFGIATYVNTKRSRDYKTRKNTLRHDYSKLNMEDAIAYMSTEKKNIVTYGDLFVYDDTEAERLYKKILE